ncbi:MAG: DUF72 domain-containing protein [Gammaproteobacteria bacterium]|nr:DUF72 domain-containing protein [Gammaproteobacteria bacterium]
MEVLAGTSGFSYQEWKGDFYPQDVSPAKMIGYYAEQLPAVEINNTALRLPREESIDKWAQQVPYTFRFSVKAPQVITHRTVQQGVENEISKLLSSVAALEHLLGVVLFQIPVFVQKEFSLLDAIIDYWPKDISVAFEFHHQSWHDDDVYRFLRRNNAALCNANSNGQNESIVATANWGYLRMRNESYDAAVLQNCLKLIQSQPWERVYVFFRYENNSQTPKFASQFMQLVKNSPV